MISADEIVFAACGSEAVLWDELADTHGAAQIQLQMIAKKICASCPILDQCMKETIETRDARLFRAGISPKEWRKYFRENPAEKAA